MEPSVLIRLSFALLIITALSPIIKTKSSEVDIGDNDYLRVSSNQFDGNTLNYDSIKPVQTDVDIANHIGKPLVSTTSRQQTTHYVHRSTSAAPRVTHDQKKPIDGQTWSGPPSNRNYTIEGGQFELRQLQQRQQQSISLQKKPAEQAAARQSLSTVQPRLRATTPAPTRRKFTPNGLQPDRDQPVSSSRRPSWSSSAATSMGYCKWMQLAEFKNVSYETGRMVFVDESEQPCYVLTLRGFLKWNDTLYFPLGNYRADPRGSYKISMRYPDDGSIQRLLLNCSMPQLSSSATASVALLPSQVVSGFTFEEEITILVECGYLKLKLNGDGSHVSLNSISFYQNADLDERRSWQNSEGLTRKTRRRPSIIVKPEQFGASERMITSIDDKATPMVLNKHQVFSSEPIHEAPLLRMPLISRYTCRHHIELNGSNLVQFVLERFELQRLITNQASVLSSSSSLLNTRSYRRTNPRASSSSSLFITEGNHNNDDDNDDYQVPSIREESKSIQEKVRLPAWLINSSFRKRRDTTILYKSPILAVTSNPLTKVTRCPSPRSPTSPLNFMMDPGELRRSVSTNRPLAKMDRMIAASTDALPSGAKSSFNGSYVGLVNLVVTLYLVKQILNYPVEMHA